MNGNANRYERRAPALTLISYLAVVLVVAGAWSLRGDRLIVASEGLGYWFGVVGASMMLLLLSYPLRKRAAFLRNAGAVKHWFRAHMILGILGPLLVLLHSNFTLGSFNGRVALFCTIVVAGSGIIGRYIYAKIHHGMYGRRASREELRAMLDKEGAGDSSVTGLLLHALADVERRLDETPDTIPGTFWLALSIGHHLRSARATLREQVRADARYDRVADHILRLFDRRKRLLHKIAQLRAFERLFSLWHIVHYPLFIVMVIAALIHVVAVHMY